ncbi:MAG: copper resistance protein CopC [Acetobacteraceae bacterium]|nr:copper resistance protein CopC [Acetobacteraceae bacterium]
MTLPRRVLPLLPALAILPARAEAHALVTGSEPASGARIPGGDVMAVVRFNSRIDHSRSQLLLAPVRDGGGGTADETRLELTPSPDTELRARLPALPPGRWRIRWQVLALDGHITRGDIPFAVTGGR